MREIVARFQHGDLLRRGPRDLDLLGGKDGELAPVIFERDWCFVTKNARDFRGPVGVELHAGLVCIHGPHEGFTKTEQLEAFAVVLELLEKHGDDVTNLLVEVV